MVGEVLDVLVSVVLCVEGLERHAVITHPLGAMLAELRVALAGNLAIL